MDRQQVESKITEYLTHILELTEIPAQMSVEYSETEGVPHFDVDISSEETNLLIGYHGETLNSLQHCLSSTLHKNFEEKFSVLVDVSGYRKERTEKLRQVAHSAAEKALGLQKSIGLYPMNSYERKVIHEEVSKIEGVTSASDGEGRDRRVIISPAT